ncbi:MAG TPA: PfkB family carbohydrate kinase [Acidobacteriaceae bacterium]|nr:PfkB family carbohydrate kinase [Acidobacteriaceae bacterium]
MDIVGVGLNATDTVIPVPHYPLSGSKVEIRSAALLPGGQVATAVVACRRWGMAARYVGKLGDDHAAQLHCSEFHKAGIDARIVTAAGCSSQQSFILVESSGERTVLWKRDPRLTLRPEDLRKEWITDARALLVDGHDTEAAITAATWAREAGIPVIADLDELYPGVDRLIPQIDYLIVSRDIPAQLAGGFDLRESLMRIQGKFGSRLAAATLGPEGVLAYDGRDFCYRPAFRVSVVDTTGAGDIFHAGFIYGLLQDWPLEKSLDFGCAAAALNCTGVGARGAIQPVEDIERLMATGSRYDSAFE